MTIDPVFLLPVPDPAHPHLEPVAYLLATLEYVASTFRSAEHDPERHEPLFCNADERREQLYHAAAASVANTYPEDEQAAVYDRHTARYSSLNAAQQRVATLTLHGLACDRASGTRHRDEHTWSASAIAALETYRSRKADRSTTGISGQVTA